MGCFYNSEQTYQEKFIEILIEKNKNSVILRNQQIKDSFVYKDNEIKQLQNEFYKDINDESKLIKYLEKLNCNKYKEKFDYELLLYFDVLSPINRTKFTGIKGFESSFDIFKLVIDELNGTNFKKINDMNYFKNISDLCGREKLINSENFSFKLKYLLTKKDKNNILNIQFVSSFVEQKRKYQKISVKNPELYFYNLLQSYYKEISKNKNRLENISIMVCELYKPIYFYLKKIEKKEELSDNDKRIMNILLYAPIIGNNDYMDVERMIYSFDHNDNIINNINIENNNKLIYKISNDKLLINQNDEIENKIELPNPSIYNINLMKKELSHSIFKKPHFPSFIKFIKLQYFQENNFYTYNNIYYQFNKTLLKNILLSKVIKTSFEDFYPNEEFIFDKDEIINELFNSIIFVPFPLHNVYSVTDKKTLLIFINGSMKNYTSQITYLGKSCSFIILELHEGFGNWASAYLSFCNQDLTLFKSNKLSEEILNDMGIIDKNNAKCLLRLDGGDILEILIFGRKLEYFTLNELLFLLCKRSYDVDYKTFKKNFKEANEKNLSVLYKEVSKDEELYNFFNTFNIDLNFIKELEEENQLYFNFKRNGDIHSLSRCGNLSI